MMTVLQPLDLSFFITCRFDSINNTLQLCSGRIQSIRPIEARKTEGNPEGQSALAYRPRLFASFPRF